MLAEISHGRAQSLLKQRNMLLIVGIALVVLIMLLVVGLLSKDREVVLTPVLSAPMTITSGQVTPEYLQVVTRDAATVLLNRTPEGLDYWMSEGLRLVNPAAYGKVKAGLVRIVDQERQSDITQAFAMTAMSVDTPNLTVDVTGRVTTFVGSKLITTIKSTYRFRWVYSGLSLSLVEFGRLEDVKPGDKS